MDIEIIEYGHLFPDQDEAFTEAMDNLYRVTASENRAASPRPEPDTRKDVVPLKAI